MKNSLHVHGQAQTFNCRRWNSNQTSSRIHFSAVFCFGGNSPVGVCITINQNRVREAASRTKDKSKQTQRRFHDRVHGRGNSTEACVRQLQSGSDHFNYSAFNRLSRLTEGTLNWRHLWDLTVWKLNKNKMYICIILTISQVSPYFLVEFGELLGYPG